MTALSSSLIITVYNRADFLGKVLASVERLNPLPNEVIVAEDGESHQIKEVVERYQKQFPVPLLHVRHADVGNRKPIIMNKALSASSHEYLIFVDGDCVLRWDFVGAHLEHAYEGAFLTGRRVDLSAEASEFLSEERIRSGYLEGWSWKLYWDSLFGKTRHLGRMFRTPRPLREAMGQNHILDIRGCNFSVHRKNLLAINGFGNDFSGAYGEDSDAEYRLKFLGLAMKSVKGAAIQFHLWHKEQSKDPHNQVLLQNVLKSKTPRTSNGLEQLNID